MAGPAFPIDIATPTRHRSSSPSSQAQQPSNLTSALQGVGARDARIGSAIDMYRPSSNRTGSNSTPQDISNGGMGTGSLWGGAKPISVNDPNREKTRRESLAASLVGGMSWGGMSVGSWIRDDIIMTGTSPFPTQSPSYHSSSYLPKLEANFMRDFDCCGITLPSLHDLLQHFEECHAGKSSQPLQRSSQSGQGGPPNATPNNKAALANGASEAVQYQAQQQQTQQQRQQQSQSNQQLGFSTGQSSIVQGAPAAMSGIQMMRQQQHGQQGTANKIPVQSVQDMDTIEDMEMDEDINGTESTAPAPPAQQQQQQPLFGQLNGGRAPPLNLNTVNVAIGTQGHQGLKSSQPTTPATSAHHGLPFQNNPTVSSVNTPTLSAQPLQQQYNTFSPDSSVPGTPGEVDNDFVGNLPADMSLPNNPQFFQENSSNFGYGFGNGSGNGSEMLELCIDEPAKRLYSPGGLSNQQYAQFRMGGSQFGGAGDIPRKMREQQMLNLVSGNINGSEEVKPFKCPVIGCEKAYKNQNGLKYHKNHGHNNQQLQENFDGTYSIMNPETCAPYPGTVGMEKEKPYSCDVCRKRYKNLNGLKYHKGHSPQCDPELKIHGAMATGGPLAMAGMNVNVAGAGLPGIGEEMVQ
ncbi:MAG: Transcriptional regulator of ribosomal biogenesis proteins [Pycnora praestabilis]|nr:MAG: Transcriptional regulator of ribosomal biogenesis proteins [Pycnora praestabilis]